MSQTRFPLFPLAVLIIVGLLIMGGFAISRISWLDGYKTGQLVARGTDGAVIPYPPYQPGCGGPLITLGLIFVLILVVGKLFRFWAWKGAWGSGAVPGGPKGERWVKHWHRHRPHGPVPPWCWGWEEPAEEEAEEPTPDTDTSDTDAKAEV